MCEMLILEQRCDEGCMQVMTCVSCMYHTHKAGKDWSSDLGLSMRARDMLCYSCSAEVVQPRLYSQHRARLHETLC